MTKTPIEPKDIRKGYLIRVEYGDVNREGKAAVEYYAARDGFYVGGTKDSSFLIDRPKPPVVLPTEPGVYVSYLETPLGTTFHNLNDGRWSYIDGNGWLADSEVAEYLPLTKLEPVAETAKRVLDRVMDATGAAPTSFTSEKILEVAAEFGVTS